MAQTLKEVPLSSRSARSGLAVGTHWRGIDPDTHLGYRKGKRGGRWLARWYSGQGKYSQVTLATADDKIGAGTLSFDAAVKIARETVTKARLEAAAAAAGPIITVGLAIEEYIKRRDARATARAGRPTRSDASSRLRLHVTSNAKLAATELSQLKESELAAWRASLTGKLATRKRLSSDFRAALNAAATASHRSLPAEIGSIIARGLRPSEIENATPIEPVARDNQILTDHQVRAIVSAAAEVDSTQSWNGDLARMVLLLASTGARFSQLIRMRVADVQTSRLLIPVSRKGRSREEIKTPVPVSRDVIEALEPIIRGRASDAMLLERWFHVQNGRGKWQRDERGPWRASFEITKVFRVVALAAGLPGVTAYSLRHSSIVRGLRAGLPIRLVASLHDTSTVMIERFYARFIADGLEDLAAAVVVSFAADPKSPDVKI
jgi:integrase